MTTHKHTKATHTASPPAASPEPKTPETPQELLDAAQARVDSLDHTHDHNWQIAVLELRVLQLELGKKATTHEEK